VDENVLEIYQGWRFVLIISVIGTMFGVLAPQRRSLRPGMVAHFLQDGIGGLLARKLLTVPGTEGDSLKRDSPRRQNG